MKLTLFALGTIWDLLQFLFFLLEDELNNGISLVNKFKSNSASKRSNKILFL